MAATTASNLMIARRANIKARADFATWLMMEKLRSVSSLPVDAQGFLAKYNALLGEMPENDAADRVIGQVYASYYAVMGGTGEPPEVEMPVKPVTAKPAVRDLGPGGNVTPFRKVKPAKPAAPAGPKKLPVGLIFLALVVIAVAIKFLSR